MSMFRIVGLMAAIAGAGGRLAGPSRAARAKAEELLKETGAQLWIEHDIATHEKLPESPAYIE